MDFVARSGDGQVFLTREGATFVLKARPEVAPPQRGLAEGAVPYAMRMSFVGRTGGAPEPLQPLPGTASYFIGGDPAAWRTGLPTYARVAYRRVYDGVDVIYYGSERHLEYDLALSPGADASQIALRFDGADRVSLDEGGDLHVHVGRDDLLQRRPVAYQDGAAVDVRYVLEGGVKVALSVGQHDPHRALVVDPVLLYATYLGTSDNNVAQAIAVDAAGDAYLTGFTSTTFPVTPGVLRTTRAGGFDAFVVKMSAAGTIRYATYLGGSADDVAQGIAVDSTGSAYIAGYSTSKDFPTTAGALQASNGGARDAFISRLNASGTALLSSTYLGGLGDDEARAIAVDAAGDVFVAGETHSTNFPKTATAFQGALGGANDGFVAKLGPSGTLLYGTYLGGASDDAINGLALDVAGNAYVVGYTGSKGFPTTAGAIAPSFTGGPYLGFLTKLAPSGSTAVYSTFLLGTGSTFATAVAVDAPGNAYITGYTSARDFPVTAGAIQAANAGNTDAFIAKVNPAGSAFAYATYLGGDGSDGAYGIALDGAGAAYLAGFSESSNFPTTPNAFLPSNSGDFDAFLAKVNPDGGSLSYCTLLGGANDDIGYALALDNAGKAYITGGTRSVNFPVTLSLHPNVTLGNEAFIVQFDATGNPLYSVMLGGADQSYAYGLAVDGAGSAYVAGSSFALNFPTTTGALDPAAAGGEDAVIAKLTPDGTGLVYSTYLGGQTDDAAQALAVDAQGNAYLAGFTGSTDFPTTAGAAQPTIAGSDDGFIAKLNPAGNGLVYSTFLGGTQGDFIQALALAPTGEVYVTGYTTSKDFPVSAGAMQRQFGGGIYDSFVSKLSASGGAFEYGTYLGGGGDDLAYALTIDGAGNAYVVGGSTSGNFPLVSPLQAVADGGYEGFVSKLNPGGTALTYSTYLGGAGDDYAHAVQVDDAGNAYVVGYTVSTNFPVTPGALQAKNAGGVDVFVSKLNAAGSALAYSTYLGGSQDDVARALTLDAQGHAFLAGSTASIDFPVSADAVQGANGGAYDGLIAELSSDGASLVYGSYLGGANSDYAYAIAIDSNGHPWLGGQTLSTNFPTTPGAVQPALSNIQYQIFVASMDVTAPSPDAGTPDAGRSDAGASDAGTGPRHSGGCGCGAAAGADACLALLGALLLVAARRRRSEM